MNANPKQQRSSGVTPTDPDPLETAKISTGRRSTLSADTVVDIGALSHQGLIRDNNEDSFLVTKLERRLSTLLSNLPTNQVLQEYAEVAYGMIVADGMGGAAAGEVASRTAIAALI